MKNQFQSQNVPKRISQNKSQPALPRKVVLLQKRLRNHIINQFEFTSKMEFKNRVDFSRRANKVNDFQGRIIRAGLKAIGMSHDELVKRQKIDMASARKGAERRRKELIEKSQKLALAHKQKTKKMQAFRKLFEKEVDNPRLSVFLCERVSHHFWGSGGYTTSSNPTDVSNPQYINSVGENITRWCLKIGNTSGGFGMYTAILSDEFVWNSDREGVLDAEAFFHLNAIYDIGLVGKCFGHSNARLRITPLIYVAQNVTGTTDVILVSSNSFNSFLDIDVTAGCVNIVSNGMATPLDTGEVSLSRSNFPLQANKPVLVTVAMVVEAYAYNGASVDLDFLSEQSFAMDVPCAALIIDS